MAVTRQKSSGRYSSSYAQDFQSKGPGFDSRSGLLKFLKFVVFLAYPPVLIVCQEMEGYIKEPGNLFKVGSRQMLGFPVSNMSLPPLSLSLSRSLPLFLFPYFSISLDLTIASFIIDIRHSVLLSLDFHYWLKRECYQLPKVMACVLQY